MELLKITVCTVHMYNLAGTLCVHMLKSHVTRKKLHETHILHANKATMIWLLVCFRKLKYVQVIGDF